MLIDLITTLTASCSPHIRALGYLDEAIAMRRRYRRCRDAWQPHLENSRRFVLSAAEKCASRSKVVVLGSGLLLDVPLAELSALFSKVILKDVVCLPEVRKQLRTYENVSFSEQDVTGVAEQLYRSRRNVLYRLPDVMPPADDQDAGLIVSLNILSQLWVVPRTCAARNLRGMAEDVIDDWCRQIVESHYLWLRSRSCDVCLVADHAFTKRDHSGAIFSRDSTIYGLKLPEPDASWTWNIVPQEKRSASLSKELIVGAWHLR